MALESRPRAAKMTVDLGGEQVDFERALCHEELGKDFSFQIDIIAKLGEINMLPHLGKPIAVHVNEDGEHARYFHGLITEAEFRHESGGRHHYRVWARPFTHYLSHNVDMAIFQDLSVKSIIQQVLDNAGMTDYEFQLTQDYPKRVYCVQYRESDLTFITRLMEEEGIYFYFKHSADKHVLVFCDAPSVHQVGNPAKLLYNPASEDTVATVSGKRNAVSRYAKRFGERVRSTAQALVTLRSFDFEKPERPLQAQTDDQNQHPHDKREVYSYPALYKDEGRGKTLTTRRLAMMRRDRQVYHGDTRAVGLTVGYKVSMEDHASKRLNSAYLVTKTEHVIETEAYRAEEKGNKDEREAELTRVTFEAIPATTPFHMPHHTPKPIVHGLESAIVSGPDGEEIFCDEYGRVKVRFHWDRGNTPGEKSTCWVRVAQWGGLGNVILPRIGQEVVVDFLHGNPDEPVILGWVFNKAQMPVYELPKHKTRHVIRSRSYMGGKSTQFSETMKLDTGDPGANEIRYEDKAGEEEFFMHAEKDMNVRVRHDKTLKVGHNETIVIGWDRNDEVKNDETTKIGKNQTLEVIGKQTETIKLDRTIKVTDGNDKLTIEKGNSTTEVKMGNMSIKASLGKIDIEAMQSITLKVGGSSITIDQIGVKVKGAVMVEVKGVMVQSSADAMQTIKGGLVMIN